MYICPTKPLLKPLYIWPKYSERTKPNIRHYYCLKLLFFHASTCVYICIYCTHRYRDTRLTHFLWHHLCMTIKWKGIEASPLISHSVCLIESPVFIQIQELIFSLSLFFCFSFSDILRVMILSIKWITENV